MEVGSSGNGVDVIDTCLGSEEGAATFVKELAGGDERAEPARGDKNGESTNRLEEDST